MSGPSSRPLIGLTVGQMVDRAARKYGDKEAVVSVHQNIRFGHDQDDSSVAVDWWIRASHVVGLVCGL